MRPASTPSRVGFATGSCRSRADAAAVESAAAAAAVTLLVVEAAAFEARKPPARSPDWANSAALAFRRELQEGPSTRERTPPAEARALPKMAGPSEARDTAADAPLAPRAPPVERAGSHVAGERRGREAVAEAPCAASTATRLQTGADSARRRSTRTPRRSHSSSAAAPETRSVEDPRDETRDALEASAEGADEASVARTAGRRPRSSSAAAEACRARTSPAPARGTAPSTARRSARPQSAAAEAAAGAAAGPSGSLARLDRIATGYAARSGPEGPPDSRVRNVHVH